MDLKQASEETAKILMPFVRRLHKNIARINQLLTAAQEYLASKDHEKLAIGDDFLRSAVVFLHATLEDALRTLAMLYLPLSSEIQLNDIPLIGTGNGNRPEKFFLGKLAEHRGKSVDNLLEESVSAYLQRSNYNNTVDVAYLLRGLGINLKEVSPYFPAIDELMKRRHEIVHRADMVFDATDALEKLNAISTLEIKSWIEAVRGLTTYMLAYIIGKEMTDRLPYLNEHDG